MMQLKLVKYIERYINKYHVNTFCVYRKHAKVLLWTGIEK